MIPVRENSEVVIIYPDDWRRFDVMGHFFYETNVWLKFDNIDLCVDRRCDCAKTSCNNSHYTPTEAEGPIHHAV